MIIKIIMNPQPLRIVLPKLLPPNIAPVMAKIMKRTINDITINISLIK